MIGLTAGFVCFAATNFLKRVLHIDDSLDVFPVHGVGGILGTLLVGIFASTELGIFSGQGFAKGVISMEQQLGIQFIGVMSVLIYTAIITFIILKIVDITIGLRVTKEDEIEGLDIALHEERGYII